MHCSDEALACSRKRGATVGHSSFVDLDSHSRASPPFGRPALYVCRLQQFCATRNRCFTHDALVQCHTEDASVTPSRPFACLSPFIGREMELTLLNTAPLVYQEGEVPPPAFVVDAPQIAPAPVPPEPAALTDDDDELKRVPVLILVFQGPCQQHTLWISSDESLDSFMTRASILLNPDPVHFDLLPANPQPDGTRFLFVLAPNWWALSGMRPVVCHLRQPDCEPFVHVVFPGEDLEASLPHAIFGMHGQLDLYLPPTSPGQHVAVAGPRSLALELQPGALLLFQADAGLPPDLLAPLEHLRAMSHVRAEEFPDDVLYSPHPCDVVLLGVEYEQYVLRLGGVPIKRLVSSSLGIAEADVYLHHQPVPFAQLTVAGQAVSACFGLRSRAVHGGEPVGRGMFIDCRAVGRPVVYRTFQALRLCPSDVCHMLDVGIPAGYRAWCEGAVACDKYPDYFLVEHGINLTVWVDSDSPVASPASAPAPDDGSDGMSDDSSSSDDNNQRHVSSTGGHRSRSPRRPAPGPHGRQHQPGLACPAAVQDHPAPCHRFFANGSFPLDVRRNILRSISVSKFTYGAAGLNLSAAVHRRGWCGAYVDIWRRLLRRDWASVKRTHGYEVLYVAQAPSPLLALALTRATFLRRLVLFGPAECLHLLQAHWDLQPSRSWFGLVLSDISLVAQYVESAQVLLQQRSALHALLDSFQSDDRWWIGIVRRACKVCVQDYGLWHSAHSLASSAGRPADAQCGADAASEIFSRQEDAVVFRCRMCPAAFPQRKLLCAHMAKTHGCLSPARHFAPTCWCLSCMGYFHSPLRVQQHLKQSARCLKRLLFLIAPLTVSEVHEVEADHKLHLSRLHKGHWAEFHATLPAARAFGPRQPTADERGQDEDLSLELLGRLYRPSSEVQSWIYEFIEGRSTEGKRPDSVDFWGRRFVSPSA